MERQIWKRHVDQNRATLMSSEKYGRISHKSILIDDMTKLKPEKQFVVSQTEESTEDEQASDRQSEEEGEPLLELRRSIRTRKKSNRLDL